MLLRGTAAQRRGYTGGRRAPLQKPRNPKSAFGNSLSPFARVHHHFHTAIGTLLFN